MSKLIQFDESIWTAHTDLKMYGVELGTRMTVVVLNAAGDLFIHSPVRLNSDLQKQIQAIGQVKYVVAPNKWHHLFVGDFKSAYPKAKFYCAPGLETKRKDFKFDEVIAADKKYPWSESLQHKLVYGTPIFNEVVFFHPTTKTLILTDLAMHICESHSWVTRAFFKLIGGYGKFGWAAIEKIIYIRNKKLFKTSVENILNWDIEKILLTHGTPVTSNGKERLKSAFL